MLCKMVNAWICARNERLLYLDPDVLFFAPPVELLEYRKGLVSARVWDFFQRNRTHSRIT